MPESALNIPGQQKQTSPIRITWINGELNRKTELFGDPVSWYPFFWSPVSTMVDWKYRNGWKLRVVR
ncbi:hypothetical protein Hdeb2414_s0010g00339921 [Helianthus debilis subsp. tardiflorus]